MTPFFAPLTEGFGEQNEGGIVEDGHQHLLQSRTDLLLERQGDGELD